MPTKKQIQQAREDVNIASLNEYYRWSIEELEKAFGITHISLIEKVHLKNIVKECIGDSIMEKALCLNGEIDNTAITDICYEATSRWLLNLYGLRDLELHDELRVVNFMEKPEKLIFKGGIGEEYYTRQKYNDSRKYSFRKVISPEMKKHIRIVREKSHLL